MYVLDRFYVIDRILVWNYRATNESFEYATHTKVRSYLFSDNKSHIKYYNSSNPW